MEYTDKEWLIEYDDCLSIHNVLYYTLYCSHLLINHEENKIEDNVSEINLKEIIDEHEEWRLKLGRILQLYGTNIEH